MQTHANRATDHLLPKEFHMHNFEEIQRTNTALSMLLLEFREPPKNYGQNIYIFFFFFFGGGGA